MFRKWRSIENSKAICRREDQRRYHAQSMGNQHSIKQENNQRNQRRLQRNIWFVGQGIISYWKRQFHRAIRTDKHCKTPVEFQRGFEQISNGNFIVKGNGCYPNRQVASEAKIKIAIN